MSEIGIEVIYSTASDNLVSRCEMEQRADKYGIPYDLLPRVIGEGSLFKRATTSMATKSNTSEEPIICRELSKQKSPKNTIVRVFEKRIANTTALKEVATMFFDKNTGLIKYSILTEEGRGIVNSVLDSCNRDGYSSEKEVRASIQRASDVFMGVKLRKNGGVFFIPQQFVSCWDNYAKIFEGHKCVEFEYITVSCDDRSKKTIFNAIERDIKDSICDEISKFGVSVSSNNDIVSIVRAFKDTVISGNIKIDAFNNMVNRFKLYVKKVNTYEQLIGFDLDDLYKQVIFARDFISEEFEERQDLDLFG